MLSFLSGDKFEKEVKLDPPTPFHIQEQIGRLRILGSSVNGTLCIYDISDHKRVLLWNPATDKVYVIPPNHLLPHGFCYHFCLHGFGYDHVRDDYKVIRHVDYNVGTWYTGDISITPLTPDPFWEIYSLRSNSWRKLDIQIRSDGYPGGTEVYLNGVCHWLGEIEDEIFVMSFNLSNDVFFTTPVDWDGDSF
jgi:molecular chaperone HtpG